MVRMTTRVPEVQPQSLSLRANDLAVSNAAIAITNEIALDGDILPMMTPRAVAPATIQPAHQAIRFSASRGPSFRSSEKITAKVNQATDDIVPSVIMSVIPTPPRSAEPCRAYGLLAVTSSAHFKVKFS